MSDVLAHDTLQALAWRLIQPRLLDICIAFAPLRLPPYVLLEICDWLPVYYYGSDENESLMHLVSHVKKIRLIESVHRAYKVRMCVYMRACD